MHGLGDVGRGVVDDDGLGRIDLGDPKPRVAVGTLELLGKPRRGQTQIDIASPRDADRLADVREIESIHHSLSDLKGWLAQYLLQGHGDVGLIVGQARISGWHDPLEGRMDQGRVA